MKWFTSDQHFGHKNIISYCNRPFSSGEEMDATMIFNFNSIVSEGDIVYHLGDFAFKDAPPYLQQLKGIHHLILGNHDYKRLPSIKRAGFSSIQDVLYLRENGLRIFLSHYPHRAWRNSLHGAFHLFGHCHGNMPNYYRSMDVGVDANKFFPLSLDDIIERLGSLPFRNHHELGKEN